MSSTILPRRVQKRREIDVLKDNARQEGFQIRWDVPGDGSCWFHSVLDQCDELGLHLPNVEPGIHITLSKQMQRTRAMQLRTAVLDFFGTLVSNYYRYIDKGPGGGGFFFVRGCATETSEKGPMLIPQIDTRKYTSFLYFCTHMDMVFYTHPF